jgi:hypothetical protein
VQGRCPSGIRLLLVLSFNGTRKIYRVDFLVGPFAGCLAFLADCLALATFVGADAFLLDAADTLPITAYAPGPGTTVDSSPSTT